MKFRSYSRYQYCVRTLARRLFGDTHSRGEMLAYGFACPIFHTYKETETFILNQGEEWLINVLDHTGLVPSFDYVSDVDYKISELESPDVMGGALKNFPRPRGATPVWPNNDHEDDLN